jgi:sugar fermentation stimulation protein A
LNTSYPIVTEPIQANLIERVNRFACNVELKGKSVKVYLPNSGRLEELLVPKARVLLEQRRDSGKTKHDLLLVQSKRYPDGLPIWVGLDSRLPPKLLRWALENQFSEHFGYPREIQNEPRTENGRLDLSFKDHRGYHLIETKSVNLLDTAGTARFPDAPSPRASRHIEELITSTSRDIHPWLIFVIMRADALSFSPFSQRDPTFARNLQRAKDEGVNLLAMKFDAGTEMTYMGELDILLPGQPVSGLWPIEA